MARVQRLYLHFMQRLHLHQQHHGTSANCCHFFFIIFFCTFHVSSSNTDLKAKTNQNKFKMRFCEYWTALEKVMFKPANNKCASICFYDLLFIAIWYVGGKKQKKKHEKRSAHATDTKNDSQLFIARLASCYTFSLSLRSSMKTWIISHFWLEIIK